MKRFRSHLSAYNPTDHLTDSVSEVAERKSGFNIMKLVGIVVVCLLILPLLLSFSFIKRESHSGGISGFAQARSFQMKDEEVQYQPLDGARESTEARDFSTESEKGRLNGFADARSFRMRDQEVQYRPLDGAREYTESRDFNTEAEKGRLNGFADARSFRMRDQEVQYHPLDGAQESPEARDSKTETEKGSKDVSSHSVDSPKDKHLGGLLAAGIDEASCLSRYQSFLYRKAPPHKPSSYLLTRLRKYEALHKRCGPYTASYDRTLEQLKSGHNSEPAECNYVVWISFSGLGNRILSLASAFLYAILTNRVLLVDPGTDMADLFCEPFPDTSWLLPVDFPINLFDSFHPESSHRHGNMLKNNVLNNSTSSLPAFLYLHLLHDYDDHDKLFFCDQEQSLLHKIPWLFMKTNNYFTPSLFLVPSFEQELHNLFPKKATVFHHLSRYLFHPSNPVWGLITRYYHAYLEKADEKVGIQVRVFDVDPGPFPHVLDQILACSLKEKMLPEVSVRESMIQPSGKQRSKAVLITSLSSGYSEKIRNMYWEYPSVTGEVISVYQPSHEEHQRTEENTHNRKAWAEMYLLSLTDVLITSSWSTFGYVAQGLGGLKPWILYKPENRTAPDPPCQRAISMEPCFHAPPFYDCKAKKGVDTGVLVPHVRHCEDMSWGLKLVDHDEL